MSPHALASLFAHKSWADRELFDVLATAPAEAAHAPVLHAAVRMLNHIHVVDRIFRAHLLGEPHGYADTNTLETPALDILHFAVAETDLWFEHHVAALDADALAQQVAFRFTDGDTGRMAREEMLLHVVTHGSYHRGNVGQMLKGIGVAPPRDLYTKFLHQHEPARRQA